MASVHIDTDCPDNEEIVLSSYLKRAACPCCGASVERANPKVSSRPPAENLDLAEHGRFLSGYSAKRVFFTFWECSQCSAFYCPVYYTQSQLDMLYGRQAENMSEAPLVARRKTQEAYASLLRRHSRMAGGYLELGADIGLFAEYFARHGQFQHFALYEPNREVHDQLAECLRSQNIAIRSDDFSAAHLPAGSVSTAAMIHVFDHLLDPRRMLREIWSVLEPGGVLLIVTHDVQSALAKLLGSRWPPFTLQHPQLYSRQSLAELARSAGYEIAEIVKTENYFPLTYLARAAFAVLGLPLSFCPNWERPMVGVKLGNIAVVTRKV